MYRRSIAKGRGFALGLVASVLFGCGAEEDVRRPADARASDTTLAATLELSFVDAGSGREVPVRVEVRDAVGRDHVADDALAVGGHCRDRPRALTRERAEATLDRGVRNAWTGSTQFYSAGASRVRVPAGRVRVRAWKGLEYRAAEQVFRVGAGETLRRRIPLERWIDMPARSWYGADGHLHIARPHPDDDLRLSKWMQAEDLHVANLLQWGTFRAFHNAIQYAFGSDGVHVAGDGSLLIPGQENPRTHFLGHVVVLGASEPISPAGSYLSTRATFEAAHRLGGLAGYAHFAEAFGARNGLALDLPHDVVDFVEVVQVGRARYDTWYQALDAGFRIAPTAGTDYPCGEALPGAERFYTRVDGTLSDRSWLRGIRRGHTFATNGPLLRFRVAGREMGDVLELGAAGNVRIVGEVRFDPARDDVRELHLIQNSEIVRRFTRDAAAERIGFAIERRIDEPSWLAVRAIGHKLDTSGRPGLRLGLGLTTPERPGPLPSEAHSAPVFIEIDGMTPMRASPRARRRVDELQARLDVLEKALKGDRIGQLELGEAAGQIPEHIVRRSRPELREAIRDARRAYEARFPSR